MTPATPTQQRWTEHEDFLTAMLSRGDPRVTQAQIMAAQQLIGWFRSLPMPASDMWVCPGLVQFTWNRHWTLFVVEVKANDVLFSTEPFTQLDRDDWEKAVAARARELRAVPPGGEHE